MTFKGQITELGFEIIDFHLKERLTQLGYEFIKSKQVAFKKTIGDHIILVLFYKDFYRYIQGSFEEHEYPIIEISGFITAESKAFNKWWSAYFKDEPRQTAIFRKSLTARQFMAHFKKYEFIPDEWILINKQNSELLIQDIITREKEILDFQDFNKVLANEDKSIMDYDIHLFLGQFDKAKQIMDELKITRNFDGVSPDQILDFIDKRERLFINRQVS